MAKFNAPQINYKAENHKKIRVKRKAAKLEQKHKAQKVLQSGLRTKKKKRQIAHKQRMLEREEAVKAALADAPEEVEMKQAKPCSKKAKQDAMEM